MFEGEDIIKTIGIIFLVIFVSYMVMKMLKLQVNFMNKTMEGMTGTIEETANVASASAGGVAGNAAGFNESVKSMVTGIKDSLLISKYRSDYENIIINFEEYLSLMTAKVVLSTNIKDTPENVMKSVNDIVALDNARNSLNNLMKYVDSQ